jgi:hypothetical protein
MSARDRSTVTQLDLFDAEPAPVPIDPINKPIGTHAERLREMPVPPGNDRRRQWTAPGGAKLRRLRCASGLDQPRDSSLPPELC